MYIFHMQVVLYSCKHWPYFVLNSCEHLPYIVLNSCEHLPYIVLYSCEHLPYFVLNSCEHLPYIVLNSCEHLPYIVLYSCKHWPYIVLYSCKHWPRVTPVITHRSDSGCHGTLVDTCTCSQPRGPCTRRHGDTGWNCTLRCLQHHGLMAGMTQTEQGPHGNKI